MNLRYKLKPNYAELHAQLDRGEGGLDIGLSWKMEIGHVRCTMLFAVKYVQKVEVTCLHFLYS